MREILCFGDSNTYGLIPGTKERYKRKYPLDRNITAEVKGAGLPYCRGRTLRTDDSFRG